MTLRAVIASFMTNPKVTDMRNPVEKIVTLTPPHYGQPDRKNAGIFTTSLKKLTDSTTKDILILISA